MEYLSFGPLLSRCRFHRLPQLINARQALVIGDGDGRFLARLIREQPDLQAEAIDVSDGMLRLLTSRVAKAGARDRLTTHCVDARSFSPNGRYDLIVTHFFLDCLTSGEVTALAQQIASHLQPGALWVVTDFAIPHGMARFPGQWLVAGLYAAFGILTSLPVRRLPKHAGALRDGGLTLLDRKEWLGGILFSELWQLQATDGLSIRSH